MDAANKKQLEILDELTRYCNDGAEGYFELAEKVEQEDLRTIFYRLSQQRRDFAEELNSEIIALGGHRVETGSTEGNLHQFWLNLKSMLVGNNTKQLIETAKTGEEHVYEAYQKYITNNLIPSFLRNKLVKQHDMIKGVYHQIDELISELN